MVQQKTKVICEIGLNHLGKKKYLYEYFYRLVSEDIYAITLQVVKDSFFKNPKFQDFKLELDVISDFIDLVKKSKKKIGIAINDVKKIDFCEKKKVDFYKVLSSDLGNGALLRRLAKTKKKNIFISTGMSSFNQIESALKNINSKKIELIHTSFSKKISEINLKRIQQLRDTFKLPTCYGNHSSHLSAIYSSMNYNPNAIFFYVKLNNKLNFPDNDHVVETKNIKKILKRILK